MATVGDVIARDRKTSDRGVQSDLDQRDPTTSSTAGRGKWLVASIYFKGRRPRPGPDPAKGAGMLVGTKCGGKYARHG